MNEIHPDQIFGTSHAALDDLRTFHSVFITFDRRLSVFKILTNDTDGCKKVEKVLSKLGVAFCEYIAAKGVPLEIYLICPIEAKDAKVNVRMIDSDLRLNAGAVPPGDAAIASKGLLKSAELAGADLSQEEKSKWNMQATKTIAQNQAIFERALLRGLKRVIYMRGRVQMRAHFGLFVFSKYISMNDARDIPTAEFIHNIRDPKTKGSLQQVYVNSMQDACTSNVWSGYSPKRKLRMFSERSGMLQIFSSPWIVAAIP